LDGWEMGDLVELATTAGGAPEVGIITQVGSREV
jgi:hypothetical protein